MNLISLLWYKDDHELLNSVLKHTLRFNDNSYIILHINKSLSSFNKDLLLKDDRIFINNKRFLINKNHSLCLVHYDNYLYFKRLNIPIKNISIMSSNELSYRRNVYDNYSCKYDILVKISNNEVYKKNLINYFTTLSSLEKDLNINITASTQEGCSFKIEYYEEIFKILNNYLDINIIYENGVHLDETILSTCSSYLTNNINKCYTNLILDRSVNLHDLEQPINDYYYSIKRISLDINDPIRNYIYNLV